MPRSQNFTEGKIFSPLIQFALPILAALLLQTMYGAADMLVVGRYAAAADVSAVSTGSWLMQLVTCFVVGIAMGTTILLGRKLGEGKPEEAGAIVGASVTLFLMIAVLMTVLMEAAAPLLTRIMQAPPESVSATISYLRICSSGLVFIVAYNVLGSIFRGIGDSKMPFITVAIACVINIVGDFWLVGALHMAAAGAAIATVAAQAISVILSLLILRRHGLPFTFTRSHLKPNLHLMGRIFKLGFPIAFQDVLVSISFLAITAIVNSLGVIASAGVGVAEKLCGFIMLVPSAFGQAMSAFVAQNMGANKPERAKKALLCGVAASFAVGTLMAYFSFFHGSLMTGIFSQDAAVVAAGAQYLKAYAIDCLLTAFLFCMTGYYNGCSQTTFVMVQGIIGAFGVRIPVSMLMSRIMPLSLFRVGLATPCSSLLQVLLCAVYWRYLNHKKL